MERMNSSSVHGDTLRLFLAFRVPECWRLELRKTVTRLKEDFRSGNMHWVPEEKWHLTLKFFGRMEHQCVPELTLCLERACLRSRPVDLFLAPVGDFGRSGQMSVLWAGVGGELTALQGLVSAIDQECQHLVERPESRAYHPHVTLARVRRGYNQGRLPSGIDHPKSETERFSSVELIQSRPEKGGSVYSPIQSFSMKTR